MSSKKIVSFILSVILLLPGMVVVSFAEDTSAGLINDIDFSQYSYDELVLLRENLNNYIFDLQRQYAIENGNRIIELSETSVDIYQVKKEAVLS